MGPRAVIVPGVMFAAALLAPPQVSPQTPRGTTARGTDPAIPGCNASVTTASNPTPLAIADQGVVTSSLEVSGAGPYLWDVDVLTTITHTWPDDLEITLRSPAGTIVTLTTDNGDGNNDVFGGTLWDDDADPDGTIPYGSNDGLVTDANYDNAVVETPLAPEEPLAAFTGENPNGTWTLTIADDGPQDVGTMSAWALELTTFDQAPLGQTSSATQTTPLPIPDSGSQTSELTFAGAGGVICDLDVVATITHGAAGTLSFGLTSPAGTAVTLSTLNGSGGNGFAGTRFDDDADPDGQVPYASNDGLVTDAAYADQVLESPLAPEEPLAAFRGEDPNGTWRFAIADATIFNTGTLTSWSVQVTTCGCVAAAPVLVAQKTVAGDLRPGGGVWYTIVLGNTGTGPQPDNPGDELVDALPPELALAGASASAGGATAAGNTVSWNGGLAPGASVTIGITATVGPVAPGPPVSNQASVFYDADGDGTNEASSLSDDPDAPGGADPTAFIVTAPVAIPALSPLARCLLVVLLTVFAIRALDRGP